MSQVQEKTEALIAAIEECEEYKRYREAKKKIFHYPVLKEKADEFRRCNYEFQKTHTDHFEESEKLLKEHESVVGHPLVWEYLTAENAFCRMMRQMNWRIFEKLDFEVNFDSKEML